ncbi:hypothetical protein NLU13_9500 [Sarocladium strictum]|uniref:Mannan endo-1,6-alpha-mannosidase n=1 Tax=Sarocladium strictum TaxID=5046 RepID=A0AA39GBM7_SARSR|nr:hypothetical protein NLU13_9500 [Sarocladium strictum]
MTSLLRGLTVGLGLLGGVAQGLNIDWESDASIKEAAATVAFGLAKFYTGNNTGDNPGQLPAPHYWWEAGAMFGTFIDYWDMTGDESYNKITMQALLHQAGPDRDYMPENQTLQMGNDDQGFWTMAAMSAAEKAFPDPPEDEPQWLALAQACFNEWVSRWDTEHCGGGLRWQIFPFNNGYDYKNTISNGCFFNVAARLARYTGNETYAEWAEKVWDWQRETGLINDNFQVFDGRHALEGGGCGKIDTIEWTYNAGIYLHGVSALYNLTESDKWRQATAGILKNSMSRFFLNDILYEQFCERGEVCNQDQRTFKGYLLRWLAAAWQMAPFAREQIRPLIRKAGVAAAASCVGPVMDRFAGHDGTACGFSWLADQFGAFDGKVGVGEQMNALDAIMYNLLEDANPPVTADNGGTSRGNVDGGVSDDSKTPTLRAITMADKVGAGFLTALMVAGMLGFSAYLIMEGKY